MEAKKRITKEMPSVELIGNFQGSKKKALLQCKKCKRTFKKAPYAIFAKHEGCPFCQREKQSKEMTFTQAETQLKLDNFLHNNIQIIKNYQGMSNECIVKCKNCGKKFKATPSRIIINAKKHHYMSNGCQHCSKKRSMTIKNLKRYGHSDKDIAQKLHEKHLDWIPYPFEPTK